MHHSSDTEYFEVCRIKRPEGIHERPEKVYGAESEEIAMANLETMMESWKKYSVILENWLEKWDSLSTYFCYGCQIRRLIYTTNTIEGFNRQLY